MADFAASLYGGFDQGRQRAIEQRDMLRAEKASALLGQAFADPKLRQQSLTELAPFAPDLAFKADADLAARDDRIALGRGNIARTYLAMPAEARAKFAQQYAGDFQRFGLDPNAPDFEGIATGLAAMGAPQTETPAAVRTFEALMKAANHAPGSPEYVQAAQIYAKMLPAATAASYGFVEEYDPTTGATYKKRVQTRGFERYGKGAAASEAANPEPAAAPTAPAPPPKDAQVILDAIGSHLGFQTTSAVRTPEENAALPGAVSNSQHVSGTARDFSIKGKTPEQINTLVGTLRGAGFEVITKDHGTGPHIHAELPPSQASRPASKPLPPLSQWGAGDERLQTAPTTAQALERQRELSAASARGSREGAEAYGPQFEQEASLRKEYTSATAEPREILNAYARVEGASKDPSAAGDLSMIFAFMKMLDPGSVVREGEFANAQNAAGVPDQIVNLYNRAKNGERLNPAQRDDFLRQARELSSQAQVRLDKATDYYANLAPSYKIDPARIIPGYAPKGAATADAPPVEGARKAPDGKWYVQRNGQTFLVEQ